MTVATAPSTISTQTQMDEFCAAIADHLPGWEPAPNRSGALRPVVVLAHPEHGKIMLSVDMHGCLAGEKIGAYWRCDDPDLIAALPYEPRLDKVGASIATGAQKVAAQIERRILRAVPQTLAEAQESAAHARRRAHERADIVEAITQAHGAVPSRIEGPLVGTTNTAPTDAHVIRWLGDGLTRHEFTVKQRYGGPEVGPRHVVAVELIDLTPEQAVAVAAALDLTV